MKSDLLQLYFRNNSHLCQSSIGLIRLSFRYLYELFGDFRAIEKKHAQILYNTLINLGKDDKEGAEDKERQKALSPRTVATYIDSISTVYNWAVDSGILMENPFKKVKRVRYTERRKRPYENDELVKILGVCDDRWKLIIALTTVGLRRGEILNLTVKDVDFEQKAIEVRHKNDSHTTWKWDVKDREDRIVPMTDLIEGLLSRAVLNLPDKQPYLVIPTKRYKHIMHLRSTGKLNERTRNCPLNNFRRDFCEILKTASVENKTFHALRSTACVTMMENGLKPHEVAKVLGHSDTKTTFKHYSAPRAGHLDRARKSAFNGQYRT
jgi:integrase